MSAFTNVKWAILIAGLAVLAVPGASALPGLAYLLPDELAHVQDPVATPLSDVPVPPTPVLPSGYPTMPNYSGCFFLSHDELTGKHFAIALDGNVIGDSVSQGLVDLVETFAGPIPDPWHLSGPFCYGFHVLAGIQVVDQVKGGVTGMEVKIGPAFGIDSETGMPGFGYYVLKTGRWVSC